MIDLTQYVLGADVWLGSGNIDEAVFRANGVEYLFIRMNISNGSPYMDSNFITQWAQASNFKRAPYWVVAPQYYTAQQQANFITANMPAGCKLIALDVEIHWTETPDQYAKLLSDLVAKLQYAGLTVIIYTGAWVNQYVAYWPKVDYWYARYLNAVHPTIPVDASGNRIYPVITWEDLKEKFANLPGWAPLVTGQQAPGNIAIWQVTSSYVLPGSPYNTPMDVNLMTRVDFDRIFNGSPVVIPPVVPPLTMGEKVDLMWADWIKTHPQ
jgi:hypothetical protein